MPSDPWKGLIWLRNIGSQFSLKNESCAIKPYNHEAVEPSEANCRDNDTMYLATLDWATSNPSLSSSPWMRGAPQSKFSVLIAESARAIPPRSAVALPVDVISNANSGESRTDASVPAFRVE
jgi:hypothetical protein